MKHFLIIILVLVFIVCVMLFVLSLQDGLQRDAQSAVTQLTRVQCAHWSILRCSQLLGVPVSMDYLTRRLPYREKGHSMLHVSKVLREIGFETEGRRETLHSLQNQTFPCVVHLTNPDHYVVVSAIDNQYVHVFDGDGHRIARDRVNFEKQ